MESTIPPAFSCVIRHGEKDYEKSPKFLDPVLSTKGCEQAAKCGKFLKDYLQDAGYKEIIVECSPFLRTMQTAKIIANQMGLKNVVLNTEVCEIWDNQEELELLVNGYD